MKLSIITFSFIMLFASVGVSQEVAFKILAARGDLAVQKKGSEEFVPAKTGTKLMQNDKLVLNENSYAGLVTTGGKTVELKAAGVYDINDLSGDVKANNTSMAQKYVAYVFDNLRAGTDEHIHNMSITGSVERSTAKYAYDLFLPSESRMIPAEATIYWNKKSEEAASTTVLKVYNLFDEELASFDAEDLSAQVDFSALELNPDEVYKLQVISADGTQKSNVVTLRVPSEDETEMLKTNMNDLTAGMDENSALANMVYATFLENNGLYVSAMSHYKKAMNLEPDVEAYQQAYNEFIEKMGLANKE